VYADPGLMPLGCASSGPLGLHGTSVQALATVKAKSLSLRRLLVLPLLSGLCLPGFITRNANRWRAQSGVRVCSQSDASVRKWTRLLVRQCSPSGPDCPKVCERKILLL